MKEYVKKARRKYAKRFKAAPEDVEKQNQLGEKLFDWAFTNKDAHDFHYFSVESKIPLSDLKKIARENNYFRIAYELARHIIAHRIAKGWREKSIDSSYAKRMLPIFDDEYYNNMMAQYRIAREEREKHINDISVVEIPVWETNTKKKEASA
jgi:hypothetical protein